MTCDGIEIAEYPKRDDGVGLRHQDTNVRNDAVMLRDAREPPTAKSRHVGLQFCAQITATAQRASEQRRPHSTAGHEVSSMAV